VPVELLHALAQDEDENVRRTGRFIQRLLVEVKGLGQEEGGGGWQLYRLPHDICNRRPTAIEWQLERVTALDVTSPIRQAILVAFAADWDAAMLQLAFSRRNDDFARRNRGEWKYTDLTYNVKWEHIMAVFMPPIALRKLATSPFWEVRYLVALHPRTPWETRESLSQDGNRYVRAMARANMTPDGISPAFPSTEPHGGSVPGLHADAPEFHLKFRSSLAQFPNRSHERRGGGLLVCEVL